MNICPITYKEIPLGTRYHKDGLTKISPGLADLEDFPFSAEAQRQEAVARAGKISIQGVQPKLSVRFNRRKALFEIVDQGGRYIIKPQSILFRELPENEDLTMRLAKMCGIKVPFHGLLYSADGSLSYFIQRFDRAAKNAKLQVEDFAQLGGRTRDTKYDFSMEKIIGIIDRFATFPVIEKARLFRRTIFCFLIGNEDMHLKNFSLIVRQGKQELSPAYDLVNTTLAMPGATEEMALTLQGKKSRLTKNDLIEYYGVQRLGLRSEIVDAIVHELEEQLPVWIGIIRKSFLSPEAKAGYEEILRQRASRIFRS